MKNPPATAAVARRDVKYGTCVDCGRRGVVYATGRRVCSELHRIPYCIRRREKRERREAAEQLQRERDESCALPD